MEKPSMEKARLHSESSPRKREDAAAAVRPEKEILSEFTREQQSKIEKRKQTLSSLAHFIGKDFNLPVELNEPGQGWHWDFEANKVRIDPKDLLEKPMEYLRFVISHEGGHRRVSRGEVVPREEWEQPGFSFMMNAIEDPRVNNFVAESYPRFKDQMKLAYEHDLDIEKNAKLEAEQKLGKQPRFLQAGFEYVRQWFNETQDKQEPVREDLPPEVRAVVKKTLVSAQDSWLRYPSRQEADRDEDLIRRYAQVSYEINRDEVWPEFKKLLEQDQADQQVQEQLTDMERNCQDGTCQLPNDLAEQLSPEENAALAEAIQKAFVESQKAAAAGELGPMRPIKLDELPDGLLDKVKAYIDSLPQEQREELAERARQALKAFDQEISDQLKGELVPPVELSPQPESEQESPETPDETEQQLEAADARDQKFEQTAQDRSEIKKYREYLEKELTKDEGLYEQYRREVLPVIDELENELRAIFVSRRERGWLSGFRTGKRINLKRRFQEKAKGVSVMQTKAFERRELPQEKDYAIEVLVDLSGSMQQQDKIAHTFKGAIVLAEVLNRLSIKTEIIGFNDRLHEFQKFGQPMSDEIRHKMPKMLSEVESERARWNDDGWALEQASNRLNKQKASEQFLIVLSDGLPEPSPRHATAEYDLPSVVQRITLETNQKVIGLGIGPQTQHVERFYPNSRANIGLQELPTKLAELLREVIADYASF